VPQTKASWEDVKRLPPLPRPDYGAKCGEASCGCTLVITLIVMLVGTTEGVVSGMEPSNFVARAGRTAIYTEAFVAIVCLLGLMFGVRTRAPALPPRYLPASRPGLTASCALPQDPGVIKRRPETCFPMPPKVADMLDAGETAEKIQQLGNLRDDDNRTYCVRCFVWRGSSAEMPHHCSTCQRCVRHFDHHCGVRHHLMPPCCRLWHLSHGCGSHVCG
jgi:hypothetical protein